jgi:hypothetical protein
VEEAEVETGVFQSDLEIIEVVRATPTPGGRGGIGGGAAAG